MEKKVFFSKFSCYEMVHCYQKRKGWKVHVIRPDDVFYEVYYEKEGDPMMFGFGMPINSDGIEYAFKIAWANLDNYREMFN